MALPRKILLFKTMLPSPKPDAGVITNGHPHLEEQAEVTVVPRLGYKVSGDGWCVGRVHGGFDSTVLNFPIASNLAIPAVKCAAVKHALGPLAGREGESPGIGPRPGLAGGGGPAGAPGGTALPSKRAQLERILLLRRHGDGAGSGTSCERSARTAARGMGHHPAQHMAERGHDGCRSAVGARADRTLPVGRPTIAILRRPKA